MARRYEVDLHVVKVLTLENVPDNFEHMTADEKAFYINGLGLDLSELPDDPDLMQVGKVVRL